MYLVMCTACGGFVPAYHDGGALVPSADECPDCGGFQFKDLETGESVRSD